MRTIGLVLLAGALALIGCAKGPPAAKAPSYALTEADGYDKALALAKKENRRLFIDFSASWCGPCQELKQGLHDPQVAAALKDYVVLLVDVDRDQSLAQKFKVGPIPAYFIVDANGTKLQEEVGYEGVEAFLAWLKQVDRKG